MAQELTRGHCLCGETVFEYSGGAIWCGHCHCESCRRSCASAFTTFIGVPRVACRFTGREPGSYNSSNGVQRLFCLNCGTPLAYLSERFPDEIHLYAANLDRPEQVCPQFHVHVAEQLPWVNLADSLPRFQHGSE
jgi:hypothetical protein